MEKALSRYWYSLLKYGDLNLFNNVLNSPRATAHITILALDPGYSAIF